MKQAVELWHFYSRSRKNHQMQNPHFNLLPACVFRRLGWPRILHSQNNWVWPFEPLRAIELRHRRAAVTTPYAAATLTTFGNLLQNLVLTGLHKYSTSD